MLLHGQPQDIAQPLALGQRDLELLEGPDPDDQRAELRTTAQGIEYQAKRASFLSASRKSPETYVGLTWSLGSTRFSPTGKGCKLL